MNIPIIMNKKDIIDLLNASVISDNEGRHELSDHLIVLSQKQLHAYNANRDPRVRSPYDNKPINIYQAIEEAALEPMARAAVMNAFQGISGSQLGYLLNNVLPNWAAGKYQEKMHIPGMSRDALGAITGEPTAESTDEYYKPYQTPGDTKTTYQNLHDETKGWTGVFQILSQKIGDKAMRRLMTALGRVTP